jgi:hypothetical protein
MKKCADLRESEEKRERGRERECVCVIGVGLLVYEELLVSNRVEKKYKRKPCVS